MSSRRERMPGAWYSPSNVQSPRRTPKRAGKRLSSRRSATRKIIPAIRIEEATPTSSGHRLGGLVRRPHPHPRPHPRPREREHHTSTDGTSTTTTTTDIEMEEGDWQRMIREAASIRKGTKRIGYDSPMYEDFIHNLHGKRYDRDLPFPETMGKDIIFDLSEVRQLPFLKGYQSAGRLGEGSFGEVFKYTSRVGLPPIAIKVQKLTHVSRRNVVEMKNQIRQYIDEYNIVKHLTLTGCAPNVMCPRNIYFTHNAGADFTAWIVMDVMDGGLDRLLQKPEWPEIQKTRKMWELMHQLIKALNSLHGAKVLHRDIKLENILYQEAGGLQLYLTDFGLLCKMSDVSECDAFGTPLYLDPYSMFIRKATKISDRYSLAMVLLQMMVSAHARPYLETAMGEVAMLFLNGRNLKNPFPENATIHQYRASQVYVACKNLQRVTRMLLNPDIFRRWADPEKAKDYFVSLIDPEPTLRLGWRELEQGVESELRR